MIDPITKLEYDIYTLGFDKNLSRALSPLLSTEELPLPSYLQSIFNESSPSGVGSGELIGNLTIINGYLKSGNYVEGVSGWQLTPTTAQLPNLTIVGGLIRYGKTSFTDSTNAGYFMSSLGIYFGAAADASKLKYTIADGSFDFIGTVSGRSTLTLANSIDASGNVLTDILNGRLNTLTKQILGDFTFGESGAIKMITDEDNGVWLSPTGILGKKAGATTFAIGTDGSPTFAGTLSAATGTLGILEILSTGHIRGGQTDYNTGIGFFLGYSGGYKFSIGNPAGDYFTWNASKLSINGVIENVTTAVASDTLMVSADTARSNQGSTPTKKKEIIVHLSGITRVSFDLRSNSGSPHIARGQLYLNGVAVGAVQSTQSITFVTFTEDIRIATGDKIQLYIWQVEAEYYTSCQNFRIYYDRTTGDEQVVILD